MFSHSAALVCLHLLAVSAAPCPAGDCDNEDSYLLQTKARTASTRSHSAHHIGEAPSLSGLTRELQYLAGGMSAHHHWLKDTMGWEMKTAVVDDHGGSGMLDTAQVYRKNETCAIVFSATDDVVDTQQQMGGLFHQVEFCGLEGIHGGYAQEMQQYMKKDEWQSAIKDLMECSEVYAVGASMGGSMASLFAFCANSQSEFPYKQAFGRLAEVRLVTTGAPAVSLSNLYNGVPGKCFRGSRQYVTGEPVIPQSQFHIDNLKLFSGIATALGMTDASQNLNAAATQMQQLPADKALGFARHTHASIGKLWMILWAAVGNVTLPGYEALAPMYPHIQNQVGQILQAHAASIAGVMYDPVPGLFSMFGFKHPLVEEVRPIRNSKQPGSPPKVMGCADGANAPDEDFAQLMYGIILTQTTYPGFPNHGICCYIDDADCGSKYASPWRMDCRGVLPKAAPDEKSENEAEKREKEKRERREQRRKERREKRRREKKNKKNGIDK